MAERVGIVGAGTMGAGIAQLALEAGHEVRFHDSDPETLGRARGRVRDGLARRAATMGLDADAIDDWTDGRLAGLQRSGTLAEVAAASDLVIEAALEDLVVKRAIFAALDAATASAVILATNTSALSVAAIAEATGRPERVLGLHFFNPAPIMPLVEVVEAPRTDPAVTARAMTLMTRWGKTPVRCRDSPGFIVNRVNRPFTIEALRMLEAREATVADIDRAMRAAGFPMGPFELMDLVGIDVNLAAANGVWEGLGRPDRLRPSPIQARLVADHRLGRKTGQGFYRHDGAAPPTVADTFASDAGSLPEDRIVARIRDAIDAEARLAADAGVATPGDITLALRLGAGHPDR